MLPRLRRILYSTLCRRHEQIPEIRWCISVVQASGSTSLKAHSSFRCIQHYGAVLSSKTKGTHIPPERCCSNFCTGKSPGWLYKICLYIAILFSGKSIGYFVIVCSQKGCVTYNESQSCLNGHLSTNDAGVKMQTTLYMVLPIQATSHGRDQLF